MKASFSAWFVNNTRLSGRPRCRVIKKAAAQTRKINGCCAGYKSRMTGALDGLRRCWPGKQQMVFSITSSWEVHIQPQITGFGVWKTLCYALQSVGFRPMTAMFKDTVIVQEARC
jgi:hypothetical protein